MPRVRNTLRRQLSYVAEPSFSSDAVGLPATGSGGAHDSTEGASPSPTTAQWAVPTRSAPDAGRPTAAQEDDGLTQGKCCFWQVFVEPGRSAVRLNGFVFNLLGFFMSEILALGGRRSSGRGGE